MKNTRLYESIMTAISKEIKNVLNEAGKEKFNNNEAYRFLKIYTVKAILMTMGKNAKTNDTSDAVKMKMKIGKVTKDVHVTMCYRNIPEVAISQSKMMNMKNIAFISDNKIYIVDGDVLRANWGNKAVCKIGDAYLDRIDERSLMTKFSLNFLKDNQNICFHIFRQRVRSHFYWQLQTDRGFNFIPIYFQMLV